VSSPASRLTKVSRAGAVEEAAAIQFFGSTGIPLASALLSLLDQSDDCIKVVGSDGSLQFMNCNGKKAMQIDDFDTVAGKPWSGMWPDVSRPLIDSAVAEALAGRAHRFEAACPTAKGEDRFWEVTVSPIRGDDGAVHSIMSSSRNITERRRREDQLQTIAAEMRHRLRNAHTNGAAVAKAAARDLPEHRAFGMDLAARLSRLADVQAQLLDVEDGLTVRALFERTVGAFGDNRARFECNSGRDIVLNEQGARVMALVLGELATNSLKYGALGRDGSVRMTSTLEGPTLTLTWEDMFDAGTSPPIEVESTRQGSSLIGRMISLMGGSYQAALTDGGFKAEIIVLLKALSRA
jgi:PAS domain S-box-containing protein